MKSYGWNRSASMKRNCSPRNRTVLVCGGLVVLVIGYQLWGAVLSVLFLGSGSGHKEMIVVDVSRGKQEMKFFRDFSHESMLPTEQEMERLTSKQLYTAYHSYLDNTDILCHRKLRMGRLGDGGWEVCDDFAYRPQAPCIIYSFGINNDFSFDDDAATLYNCTVFSFDPSMETKSYRRSKNVFFYDIGLGGEGGQLAPGKATTFIEEAHWKMSSLTDLKAMLHHQNKTLDILKMDIEGSEWIALAHMARTGDLSKVRQLMVEFHLGASHPDEARKRMPVLKLIERAGFRRFYSHLNPQCMRVVGEYPVHRTTCYESYFLNTNLARTVSQGAFSTEQV